MKKSIEKRISVLAVLMLSLTTLASAQTYPARPITIVIPFSAGGGADVTARTIAHLMEARLEGASILIENRPGAGGMTAANYVAKAKADGYTILAMTNSTCCVLPILYKKVGFDPARDFVPVSAINTSSFSLAVQPNGKYKTVGDIIQAAKERPGGLKYGSSGIGSSAHILTEMLMQQAGIALTHVPYQSGAAALNDLAGGRLDFVFADSAAMRMEEAGMVKVLAVSMKEHDKSLGNYPSVAEQGLPEFDAAVWSAFVVPAHTPQPVVDKLRTAVNDVLKSDEYGRYRQKAGLSSLILETQEQLDAFMASETEKWGAALRAANLVAIQ